MSENTEVARLAAERGAAYEAADNAYSTAVAAAYAAYLGVRRVADETHHAEVARATDVYNTAVAEITARTASAPATEIAKMPKDVGDIFEELDLVQSKFMDVLGKIKDSVKGIQ